MALISKLLSSTDESLTLVEGTVRLVSSTRDPHQTLGKYHASVQIKSYRSTYVSEEIS